MNQFIKVLTVITLIVKSSNLWGQAYLVKKINEKIRLDGVADESIWQSTPSIGDFWQYFPTDTILAKNKTEIRMVYDDQNIYLYAKAYTPGNKFVIPSFRRDYRAGGNDNVTFIFDTFHDNTNGFLFGTNPYGVQREALLFNGATDNAFFNVFWDNKWQSITKIYEGYYIVELAIPFTTLRYKENSKNWNFKSYRFDTQSNETSSLKQMPQSILLMSLGFTVPIEFEFPLKKNSSRVSLIPYTAGSWAKDYITKKDPISKIAFGADAKIAVTPGLNLDLTANPDFSTVEADRQVVNLTRFDITFPEQRQFFIENSDMFTGFGAFNTNPFVPPSGGALASGNQIVTPFFSRKVGIALDSTTGTNVQTPIVFGARLSGKIDDNWRLGVLNTQTGKDDTRGIRAANYSVASVSRRVFDRSNIAAFMINKTVFDRKETDKEMAYNRVAGLEYNLQSSDNKWNGKAFYHQVFSPHVIGGKLAHGLTLGYTTNKIIAKMSYEYVGAGYESEAGFVPRNNFVHISPTIGFNKFPKGSVIQRFSYGIAWDQYNLLNFGKTDVQAGPFVLMAFQSSMRLLLQFNKNYTYLFSDFDALRANGALPILKKGSSYDYYNVTGTFVSDLRKKLSLTMQPLVGQYFNGTIASFRGELAYRAQPYGILSLNFNYNKINLKEAKNDVIVIGPKTDITFSRSLFWTTYLQYNSQFKNLNINSRLQWRYAPVSDFFIVYSDNYDTGTWGPKNKAILAKATYWLNL